MEPSAQSNQPAVPPKAAASGEKNGVLAFIQSLKAPATPASDAPKPGDVVKPFEENGPLHHHFQEFAWVKQQNEWLRVSFIAHCALALLIWVGAYLAFTRPTYIQIGNPSLSEAAKSFFQADYKRIDPGLIYDQMNYFIITSLGFLHEIDAFGPPPLPILKGMVNEKILEKAQKRDARNASTVARQKLVQTLVINRVLPPIPNPQTGTDAVFVEGNISICMQDADGNPVNRVTPYRAKAILRETPVSNLNPFPFTLDDLEETAGADEVKKWDEDNKKFFSK
jgi:hypothetical protein